MDEDLYRTLVENSVDITAIIDSAGVITYVSPSVQQALGYDPEELVGEVGYEYQHPDDRDAVADTIEKIEANPEETGVVETRFRHADGSWQWVESTIQNELENDNIEGILVNCRDISERKHQEAEYERLADEYKTLLRNIEEGLFFLAVESREAGYTFRFERLNKAYEEQTGLSAEEMQGKTPKQVFGEELGSGLNANYRRCVEGREAISYQEELPVEVGRRFWQTHLAPVIRDGEVAQIVGITRNVTDRVKRERQLRRQKEQLEEFASVVSHDLRNPLNVAQARTTLLAEECESEHLSPVVRSLDRMEELIEDTLTLAKQGQVVADTEPIQLLELVGKCWKTIETDKATIDIPETPTIQGDRSRLQHVFENLFRNAIEHGSDTVTVRVGCIGDRGLYVEDTGPGIPEENRDEVFEPGHSSADGGIGFGLTIVKRIAEAHGWEVSITDGTDGGARFEFLGVEMAEA
ncbi:PAS domain S-box protein [Halovenus rubra]|uniref:histidine kinase n=2 Tax=Halovenus rubra TaxID=869890 RepID=A0ABD5XB41_9EURY|nr:PAS domain S-box protein [Halovenus rubra]